MKITLESTSQIVQMGGAECRVWEGTTESGIALTAFIGRVAVKADEDCAQFIEELKEQRPPTVVWPARTVP